MGRKVLDEHITKFITIGEMSNDKRQLESNFAKVFKLNPPSLFPDLD